MVTRDEIRQTELLQKITQDLGGEPYWVETDYYDLMWEWIHDMEWKNGSFSHWLQDQYTKSKDADRRNHINESINQILEARA